MHSVMEYSTPGLLNQIVTTMSSRHERSCPSLSDHQLFQDGIQRVLSQAESGRCFLQELMDIDDRSIARQTFFDALHSSRRLNVICDFANQFERLAAWIGKDSMPDQLAEYPELDGLDIYAVDGHSIEHASHACKTVKGAQRPSSMLYRVNMRSGLLAVIGHQPDTACGHSHETTVLKSMVDMRLPNTLFVGDRAYVDTCYWLKAKRNKGILLVTQLKSNMILMSKVPLDFDASDPINTGVTGFYMITFNNTAGHMLLTEYTDPETGKSYSFITTLDRRVRPGVVAWLYKLRWNIEKVFDVLKNRLREIKAWACSENAQTMAGFFVVSAYNFIRMLEWMMAKEQICEEKLHKKRAHQLEIRALKAAELGRYIHPLEYTVNRIFTMSAQFVRVVSNCFRSTRPLQALKPYFRRATKSYI